MVGTDFFYWPHRWLTYIIFLYLLEWPLLDYYSYCRSVWSKVSESVQCREEHERKKRKHNLYVVGRLTIPGGVQERCRCSLRDMVSGQGGDGLTIELNDPRGLLQPSWFYNSMIWGGSWWPSCCLVKMWEVTTSTQIFSLFIRWNSLWSFESNLLVIYLLCNKLPSKERFSW